MTITAGLVAADAWDDVEFVAFYAKLIGSDAGTDKASGVLGLDAEAVDV